MKRREKSRIRRSAFFGWHCKLLNRHCVWSIPTSSLLIKVFNIYCFLAAIENNFCSVTNDVARHWNARFTHLPLCSITSPKTVFYLRKWIIICHGDLDEISFCLFVTTKDQSLQFLLERRGVQFLVHNVIIWFFEACMITAFLWKKRACNVGPDLLKTLLLFLKIGLSKRLFN